MHLRVHVHNIKIAFDTYAIMSGTVLLYCSVPFALNELYMYMYMHMHITANQGIRLVHEHAGYRWNVLCQNKYCGIVLNQ